ncbi:hypothetical protein F5Y17DRAFT_111125 [Xylariaceae sp. FL0594]|nr:hypothetical protein F5Y17DRAFT_111125 [Xylariaceae sp. FL0594]
MQSSDTVMDETETITEEQTAANTWSPPLPNCIVLASMGMVMDARVMAVFRTLQELNHRMSACWARGELLDAITFQDLTDWASSRLLSLRGALVDDIESECLRLGLLCFMTLSSLQLLEPRRGQAHLSGYAYLAHNFRTALLAVDLASHQLSTLMLWLLTVGAMTVFDVDQEEHWLVKKWLEAAQALPGVLLSWEAATEQLESVIWMKRLHDDAGFKVYKKLISKT